jgi:uroporphyrinogen decarboxylase
MVAPSSRARVHTALAHQPPDRVPVDFLATPEVWSKLIDCLPPGTAAVGASDCFEPAREAVLRRLEVDCRVISYDMFCAPPESVLQPGAVVDWWGSLSRSTPNRMWHQRQADGTLRSIWGVHTRRSENLFGAYDEVASFPFNQASDVADLRAYPWPQPDWWDFSALPAVIAALDAGGEYHLRYRIGSVFETAWQLRGMQEFLMDLALQPALPEYIMDRLLEVHLENTRRVLERAGDRLDMVYFYDDVATQKSLLLSKNMWRQVIRPRHVQLVELAHRYGKPVMYHCDGALYPLIPELIDMGIDVLNPIQPNVPGMEMAKLKQEFGQKLSFHGGVDIVETLPKGTPAQVIEEVQTRVRVLGKGGGYILCSSHHLQPDTPVENILAMYDLRWR